MKHAQKVYASLIKMMDANGFKYERIDNELTIRSGFKTDDFPVEFLIHIDTERSLVKFMSKLPFSMPEDKRIDGAVAVCFANNGMVNGSFDYDISTGDMWFRLVTTFSGDMDVSREAFEYIIHVAVGTIDKYNDRFFMLSKGMMNIQEFIEKDAA